MSCIYYLWLHASGLIANIVAASVIIILRDTGGTVVCVVISPWDSSVHVLLRTTLLCSDGGDKRERLGQSIHIGTKMSSILYIYIYNRAVNDPYQSFFDISSCHFTCYQLWMRRHF